MSKQKRKWLNGSFSEVRRRVAYRIIELDYHNRAATYAHHPANAILDLAYSFRQDYPYLFPELMWYARNVAAGFKLKELRDSGWEYTNRALTKRKPANPKRFD